MYRVVAGITLALACGRIHFDPLPQSSGSGGDGGLVVDDGGTATGCGFIPCDAGATACCVGGQTSCFPDGTCGGVTYACGPCDRFSFCCDLADAGSYCNVICPTGP